MLPTVQNSTNLSPVCPEHEALLGRQADGSRKVEILPDENAAVRLPARQPRNLDPLGVAVCPVDLVSHPVAGETLRLDQARGDNVILRHLALYAGVDSCTPAKELLVTQIFKFHLRFRPN